MAAGWLGRLSDIVGLGMRADVWDWCLFGNQDGGVGRGGV